MIRLPLRWRLAGLLWAAGVAGVLVALLGWTVADNIGARAETRDLLAAEIVAGTRQRAEANRRIAELVDQVDQLGAEVQALRDQVVRLGGVPVTVPAPRRPDPAPRGPQTPRDTRPATTTTTSRPRPAPTTTSPPPTTTTTSRACFLGVCL